MPFDPEQVAIRFGCGLSPQIAPPASLNAMMARLKGPDDAAAAFPISDTAAYLEVIQRVRIARKAYRKAEGEAARKAARKTYRKLVRNADDDAASWTGQTLLRRALTTDGLRERLTAFWADHFTARGAGSDWPGAYFPYVETAIRPNVAGRFADMLRAAATQPLMLHYLDQSSSIGPNSKRARAKGRGGLNENLAREMLELHTLGADGPYRQDDVLALAKLLTGLGHDLKRGFLYRSARAEPGPHTLLGQSIGGAAPKLSHVHEALDLLAAHPATAAHLARKMAVHFVADAPSDALTGAMRAAYLASDGDLAQMTRAMLAHPDAWAAPRRNVKPPLDFIGSGLRALDLTPQAIPVGDRKHMTRLFFAPLELMGQPPGAPPGPDGWPEADADWITPQRLAARLSWAMTVPSQLRRTLPDPEDFGRAALGAGLPDSLRTAAGRAETRAEGIGLILASPEFQRV